MIGVCRYSLFQERISMILPLGILKIDKGQGPYSRHWFFRYLAKGDAALFHGLVIYRSYIIHLKGDMGKPPGDWPWNQRLPPSWHR